VKLGFTDGLNVIRADKFDGKIHGPCKQSCIRLGLEGMFGAVSGSPVGARGHGYLEHAEGIADVLAIQCLPGIRECKRDSILPSRESLEGPEIDIE